MHDRVANIVMPRDMLFELTKIRGEGALLLRRQSLIANDDDVVVEQRFANQRLVRRRRRSGQIWRRKSRPRQLAIGATPSAPQARELTNTSANFVSCL